MRKFSSLEQSVIRWIVNQPIANVSGFDVVLRDNFFNETYKMAFCYFRINPQTEKAFLFMKTSDIHMSRICIAQFLEVIRLIEYLDEKYLINVLKVSDNKLYPYIKMIHSGWDMQDHDKNQNYPLDRDGTYLDAKCRNIKNKNGEIIYRPVDVCKCYITFAWKYFENPVYPTEELIKLVERNFFSEDDEALQIAQTSLEFTKKSLDLTQKSLDVTKRSLLLTRRAFGISIIALLIGAFSYKWSTSTIENEQFSIMGKRNVEIINSLENNVSKIINKLDSVENKRDKYVDKSFKDVEGENCSIKMSSK